MSLLGISDHGVVLVDSCVLPTRKTPVRRKVYFWKSKNKQIMEEDLASSPRNSPRTSSRPRL